MTRLTLENGWAVEATYTREKYGLHRWDIAVYDGDKLIGGAANYNASSTDPKVAIDEYLNGTGPLDGPGEEIE